MIHWKYLLSLLITMSMMLGTAAAVAEPQPYTPPNSIYKEANATMIALQTAFKAAKLYFDYITEACRSPNLTCPWDWNATQAGQDDPNIPNANGTQCCGNILLNEHIARAHQSWVVAEALEKCERNTTCKENWKLAIIQAYWAALNQSLYATEKGMASVGYLYNHCDTEQFPISSKCGDEWVRDFSAVVLSDARWRATAADALRYVYT